MNKIYHLSTCDTCKRILKEISADRYGFRMQDIKANPLTEQQIDDLAKRSGSYETLINKRATLWKEEKLADKNLSEQDYKELLLRHYTFLKRPVIDYQARLFIGNDRKTIDAIRSALHQ